MSLLRVSDKDSRGQKRFRYYHKNFRGQNIFVVDFIHLVVVSDGECSVKINKKEQIFVGLKIKRALY